LFSGYNAYATVLERLDRLSRIPNSIQCASRAGLGLLPPNLIDTLLSGISIPVAKRDALVRKIHLMRTVLKNPTPCGLIDNAMSHWHPDQIRHLLGHYERPESSTIAYPGDEATQISLRDFHHYLPGDILTKVDRTTMAVSIEGREPLLDHRLAEFAFRLPLHLRRGSLGPKHLLKSILYNHVPRKFLDRPKQGFSIPKAAWLQDDLRELVEDFLAPERIRRAGIMDFRSVSRVTKNFYAGNMSLAEPLWFLLTFEMWRERWD
jgi:asparagine synthase (glutamine-hydrolysing)